MRLPEQTIVKLLVSEALLLLLRESRKRDLEAIQEAEGVFDSVLSFLKGLNQDPKRFTKELDADPETGRLSVLQGKPFLPELLSVVFAPREKKTLKARARRHQEALSGRLLKLEVILYVEFPEGRNKAPRAYNAWLARNLVETLESDEGYRSSFVHEYVHALDFRRMDPEFLLRRSNSRLKQPAAKKDFAVYVNDPVETNAYFSQALADVLRSDPPKTLSPAEFADRVLDALRPQAKRHLSPRNRDRMLARAATAWEYRQFEKK